MPVHQTIEKVSCTHCGEPCEDEILRREGVAFCCAGCETVYDLLHESGLGTYYDLDSRVPGISMRSRAADTRYEHLDDAEVSARLLDFTDGKSARITLKLPQIHCASCIWLLEHLHRLNPAVTGAEVYFDRREAAIRFDIRELPLSRLAALLTSIGYAPEFNLEQLDRADKKSPNRPTYLKIGIAGFAFGNIMLFSLPEYLSGPGGVDAQFLKLFGALNIILALPVFLYSSLDFFRPALMSVQQRQWSMDIAISLGIIAMFFRSLYEITTGLSTGYMDSFTMLVFLLLVGRLFQTKTYETLSFERDYRSYFPMSVIRIRDNGAEESVAAPHIAEGDTVLIRNGELLPADAVMLDDHARMDFSFVTGESEPVSVAAGDRVYAGGRNAGTGARFRILKPVSGSYLTRLWNNEVFRKSPGTTLRSLSQRFSRYFSPAVIGIATISALYWLPTSPATAINAFTAVLIVACPCALALSAPFTLGWATNLLSRAKLYLKNGEVVEHLADIDAIVFDKTGTLTERGRADVSFIGRDLTSSELEALMQVLHENTHPLGREVHRHLIEIQKEKLIGSGQNGTVSQLSTNGYSKSVHPVENYCEVTGKGVVGRVGATDIRIGSAEWAGVYRANISNDAVSKVYIRFNDEVAGYFEIRNLYRAGLAGLAGRLKKNANLFLLSGDKDREKQQLSHIFGNSNMLFDQSPEEKLGFVQNLRNQGRSVLMIGDGLNDAGALKTSTVGISLAEDTSGFTPASDVIMAAESFGKLDRVLDFAKSSKRIIYISFAISVLYNVVGLAFAVTGTLSPLVCAIIMPVSSITVIAWTTLATHGSAWRKGIYP